MVGAGGAIINYLFPGARGAPESKGAENIVSMEDIRLEQGLHEECGVFGIYDPEGSCAQTTYYGLYALQHRGQEACGIAAINDREQSFYKDVGLVSEVFDRETLQRLNGTMAVGHVRYATTGAGARENAQPLTIKYVKGTLAVVHNGNLVDVDRLRARFEYQGAIFHTTSDSELIAYAIAQARLHGPSVEDAVCRAVGELRGAFSLIVMSPRKLIACRDPWGFRPLCMGRKGKAVLFASESCAIESVGGTLERELDPGEIVVVEEGQVRSIRDNCCRGQSHMCIFEYIYFARPDSVIAGQSVHEARVNAGRLLARRFARHARAARLGGLLRLIRRLFGGLRLRARLARRGVRRLRLALGGRLGVSARRRTAARRAVSVLAVLGIGIAALVLIRLVQVFVFVFCHKNFLSFSARGFARAASNRRFDASAFWDLIALPCRRRSSRRSTSILSEAGIRRRAKIHNIFIIHENLSYRNKNRLIRSISRFPRLFT